MSNTTMSNRVYPYPLDVDTTTRQTINNLTCFVLGFSFCIIAFIAQIANIVLVFRQTVGKSRRIFFYLLLTSAVLCSSLSVLCGARVLIIYLTGHSQAWIEKLNTVDLALYPELDNIASVYNSISRSINIAYSLFSLLYILCVQLRFQSIRAIFQYPKWVDYALYLLTLLLWFSTVFLWTLALYDPKTKLSIKMATVWSFYVLLADNVFSGIFLWRLSKALREIRGFSQRRGKVSQSINRSMIGMCVAMWATLILFTVNPIVFSSDENQNMYSIVFCISFAIIPILFAFGIVWMQAVLQLYGAQQDGSAPRSAPVPLALQDSRGAHDASFSMDAGSRKEGWKSLDEEGRGMGPKDGSEPMVEERYVPYPSANRGK